MRNGLVINHKALIEQAMDGLGIPQGTSVWPYPHKPLGAPKGKGAPKVAKGVKSKGRSKGMKQKKGGNFAGWD